MREYHSSVVGQDKDGRTITIPAGERIVEITRRSRIIAVSDTLARAVVELLARRGHSAAIGHVQVDPAAEGNEEVLGLVIEFGGGARWCRCVPVLGTSGSTRRSTTSTSPAMSRC